MSNRCANVRLPHEFVTEGEFNNHISYEPYLGICYGGLVDPRFGNSNNHISYEPYLGICYGGLVDPRFGNSVLLLSWRVIYMVIWIPGSHANTHYLFLPYNK